ncbi:LacI family DNA-binding transcriptional regulator [Lacrimispora sp. 38-1]|uniref:LacI family DNA-binding transcriptional regulator n=1 Tax=Lacrimispora sp. 38-1 TaxID=3125778 RepID=UPI003CF9A698
MITMTEIAKLTGVSQATVSRVLNGNTSVNTEVKKKVLDCAKKHNYQPNIMAQSLVGNQTFLLGMVVTDISNPFFAELVKAIESEAAAKGYTLMLFNTDYDREREKKYLDILKRYRADGVLLVPVSDEESYVEELKHIDIPMVSVTLDLKIIDSVYISHYDAGAKVANHLLGMGFDSFIFVGSGEDEKEKGFIFELRKSGIDIEKHHFTILDKPGADYKEILIRRLKEEEQSGGIGIFANNDVRALKVLEVLKELKIDIPQDVALVGFDNTFICKIATPALTSVAQPIEEIGRLAVERIVELIRKENQEQCVRYQLDTRLITRASTIKTKKKIS